MMLKTWCPSARGARARLRFTNGNLRKRFGQSRERMDKFLIKGGKASARHRAHQRRKKFRAPGYGGRTADCRARSIAQHPESSRPHHHEQAARVHVGESFRHRNSVPATTSSSRHAERRRRPIRACKNHARLDPDAGPADGTRRRGARFASRRLRDWRASRGPPPHRSRKNGR